MYSSQRYTKSVATQKMWKSFQTWNCRKKYKYQGGLWSQLWCNLSWYFKGIWFFNTQVCVLSHSVVFNSATLSTVAHQAPLSMEFSRQEYWSGLPCLPPGDLPNPGIELTPPALGMQSLNHWTTREILPFLCPRDSWYMPVLVSCIVLKLRTCLFQVNSFKVGTCSIHEIYQHAWHKMEVIPLNARHAIKVLQ